MAKLKPTCPHSRRRLLRARSRLRGSIARRLRFLGFDRCSLVAAKRPASSAASQIAVIQRECPARD